MQGFEYGNFNLPSANISFSENQYPENRQNSDS